MSWVVMGETCGMLDLCEANLVKIGENGVG